VWDGDLLVPFVIGADNDDAMAKGSEMQGPAAPGIELGSRRRRARAVEPNEAFARAFADALRDILHDEQRRAAWA
jgi:hypothetical protein